MTYLVQKIEAALSEYRYANIENEPVVHFDDAMTAIRQALADAGEPVADAGLMWSLVRSRVQGIHSRLRECNTSAEFSAALDSYSHVLAEELAEKFSRRPDTGRVAELEAQCNHFAYVLADIAAALPSPYYMDPPDGGCTSIAEQVRRMAADVEATRRQLAESAKCAFEYAAKVGELERQLAESREREGRLAERLEAIGDYAHDRSTGPAVWDPLWEIRAMAYEAAALAAEQEKNDE